MCQTLEQAATITSIQTSHLGIATLCARNARDGLHKAATAVRVAAVAYQAPCLTIWESTGWRSCHPFATSPCPLSAPNGLILPWNFVQISCSTILHGAHWHASGPPAPSATPA